MIKTCSNGDIHDVFDAERTRKGTLDSGWAEPFQ